ncbi:hypothetical protein [Hymenobacter fodinae]|uniref:Uncharacterized protein n=1 Tax=Hymenobacter fodinae TaxID=2510796 RepID=A0A4Z0P628_9BACT|nr:hypothetical protein [Hymenobacter fodinae]TGE07741.1 hypothetical protein EU556_08280 [Hymenobacter fodinae]
MQKRQLGIPAPITHFDIATTTEAPTQMWAAEKLKLRVNLTEYKFMESALDGIPASDMPAARQAVVIYARLHLGLCLLDESLWHAHQMNLRAQAQECFQLTAIQ